MFRAKAADFTKNEKWLWVWANDYPEYEKTFNEKTREYELWSPFLKFKVGDLLRV